MTKKHDPPIPRKVVSLQMGTIVELDRLRNTSYGSSSLSYDCVVHELLRVTDSLERELVCRDYIRHGHQYALKELLLNLDKAWKEQYSEEEHPITGICE